MAGYTSAQVINILLVFGQVHVNACGACQVTRILSASINSSQKTLTSIDKECSGSGIFNVQTQ